MQVLVYAQVAYLIHSVRCRVEVGAEIQVAHALLIFAHVQIRHRRITRVRVSERAQSRQLRCAATTLHKRLRLSHEDENLHYCRCFASTASYLVSEENQQLRTQNETFEFLVLVDDWVAAVAVARVAQDRAHAPHRRNFAQHHRRTTHNLSVRKHDVNTCVTADARDPRSLKFTISTAAASNHRRIKNVTSQISKRTWRGCWRRVAGVPIPVWERETCEHAYRRFLG